MQNSANSNLLFSAAQISGAIRFPRGPSILSLLMSSDSVASKTSFTICNDAKWHASPKHFFNSDSFLCRKSKLALSEQVDLPFTGSRCLTSAWKLLVLSSTVLQRIISRSALECCSSKGKLFGTKSINSFAVRQYPPFRASSNGDATLHCVPGDAKSILTDWKHPRSAAISKGVG